MAANIALKKYFDLFKSSLEKAISCPTEETYEEWEEMKNDIKAEVEQVQDGSKVSRNDILEILDYMQQKIEKVPEWPTYKHEGPELRILEDVATDMFYLSEYYCEEESGRKKVMSELVHRYHVMCYKAGPSLPQCDYLYELQRISDISSYWRGKMKKEMLKEIMDSLMHKEIRVRDKEEDAEILAEKLRYAVVQAVFDDVTEKAFLDVAGDTAKFVLYAVNKVHYSQISEYYQEIFNMLKRRVLDEGNLYTKTKEDVWEKHLDAAEKLLLQKMCKNDECQSVFEDFMLVLVKHVKEKCQGDQLKKSLGLLLKFLLEIMDSLAQQDVHGKNKQRDEKVDKFKYKIIQLVLEDVTEKLLQAPDDTANFVIYVVEKVHSESEKISKSHKETFKLLKKKVFDQGYLYSKTQEDAFGEHLLTAKGVLLKENFGNRDCQSVYEEYTVALVKHIRYGCEGEKQKHSLGLLAKFLMEIKSKGNKTSKAAIEKADKYAKEYFIEESKLALASADDDPYAALIEGTKLLDWKNNDEFEEKYKNLFETQILPKLSADTTDKTLEFIIAAIEAGREYCIKWSIRLLDKRNGFDFKKRKDVALKILDAYKRLDDITRTDRSYYHQYLYEALIKALRAQKILLEFEDDFIEIVKIGIPKKKSFLHRLLDVPADDIRWAKKIESAKEIIELIYERIQLETEEEHAGWAVNNILRSIFKGVQKFSVKRDLVPSVAKIFNHSKDKDFIKSEGGFNLHHIVLSRIMQGYLFPNKDEVEILKPMIQGVKELWECGEQYLERDAEHIMTSLGRETAALVGDNHAEDIINKYLDENDVRAFAQFHELYKEYPDLFHPRLQQILDKMKDNGDHVTTTIQFFWQISKTNRHVITQDHVDCIAPYCQNSKANNITALFLQEVAQNIDPHLVDKHGDTILEAMNADSQFAAFAGNILAFLACIDSEHAEKYTKFMVEFIAREAVPSNNRLPCIYGLKTVAHKYKEVVAKYKGNLEKQKTNDQFRDNVQAIIDVLEDRTLENLDKAMKEQEEDIENLDQRVTTAEENVDNLGKEVGEAKTDIRHIQEDVNKVEGKVDDLENVVEETKERVEELEHTTLSHAPEWSHEVCKLMNPEADHDWRLLAQRLGYTNDDIRNWASQPDPCMSLLDEWFATHKTREATHAVLKSLQEMNRTDAALTVEKALKAVEDIIQDQPKDYDNPPPVFISYQWGLQQEVKLLKKHLKDAGYEGWMDIGQMGGGDKLYEKIDQGIRAAKVVICCVSDKYAASPNCNREVALCVNLGKPIIPLLMEKMSWPPPGSMGPIFGEYLFIRFFVRSGEETGDQRYWPASKFQELLMQLRYNIIPDKSLVTEDYSNWWQPTEDKIIIKPKKNEKESQRKMTEMQKEDNGVSPSVFISYQWGKQKQIKALYRRLTSEGYHCWLDINQMGGGDSLYDKIDRGIRGCKVVVSCVTTKYSLSANCRREISLADAIKKPIIPLLLEKMSWPPEGPMSMPFTQLLYIDFCKPNADIQNHWEVPQFKELLGKIRSHAPETDLNASGENQNNSKAQMENNNKRLSDSRSSQVVKTPVHVTANQKKSAACNIL